MGASIDTWICRVVLSALCLVAAPFAAGFSAASEVDRVIPVLHDDFGSEAFVTISREGERSTATPCVSAAGKSIERIVERVSGKARAIRAGIEADPFPGGAGVAEPAGSPCSIETLRRRAAGKEIPPAVVTVPEEVTLRNVKGFLKAVRAARKGPSGATVVFPFPDRRLGMADRSPAGAD